MKNYCAADHAGRTGGTAIETYHGLSQQSQSGPLLCEGI